MKVLWSTRGDASFLRTMKGSWSVVETKNSPENRNVVQQSILAGHAWRSSLNAVRRLRRTVGRRLDQRMGGFAHEGGYCASWSEVRLSGEPMVHIHCAYRGFAIATVR